MARWWGWMAGAGAVASGAVVMGPDDALHDWGKGFIDQPATTLAASPLDEALDLKIDGLDLLHPEPLAELAAPLLARWQADHTLTVHFGPAYADGVRPVHVDRPCSPDALEALKQLDEKTPAATRTCGFATAAQPVRCPDAGGDQRCYYVPLSTSPVRFYAAVTLRLDDAPRPDAASKRAAATRPDADRRVLAEGSVLALVPHADTLQGLLHTADLSGAVAKLDGISLADSLRQLDHPEDLDADADGLGDGWRFEFSYRAEGRLRRETAPARLAKKDTLYASWRVGGDACPTDAVAAALKAQAPELKAACLTAKHAARRPLRWSGRLAADGTVGPFDRHAGAVHACIEATVAGFDLPHDGAECTLELVLERSRKGAARPWRWAPGRTRKVQPTLDTAHAGGALQAPTFSGIRALDAARPPVLHLHTAAVSRR